jgi:SAM-dependent methyltransferase
MASVTWGKDVAEIYDAASASMFDPAVLEPAIDCLADLAAGGAVLEFASGTGRLALPLSARGLAVQGIELSPDMVERMNAKPGAEAVPVTIGDMTSTRVAGSFSLVVLAWNTIMNVTTQEEQVAVFANAAAHLPVGGCFVVEVLVPQLRRLPVGEIGRVFALEPNHVGVETYDDTVGQISTSHHWIRVGGRAVSDVMSFRYVWPSELDLMGQLVGFRRRDHWSNWSREPFTSESTSQVAVFERV